MSILTNDKERIERFYHIGRQLDIIAEWADGVQVIAAEPNRVIVGDTYKLSAQLQILKVLIAYALMLFSPPLCTPWYEKTTCTYRVYQLSRKSQKPKSYR